MGGGKRKGKTARGSITCSQGPFYQRISERFKTAYRGEDMSFIGTKTCTSERKVNRQKNAGTGQKNKESSVVRIGGRRTGSRFCRGKPDRHPNQKRRRLKYSKALVFDCKKTPLRKDKSTTSPISADGKGGHGGKDDLRASIFNK